MDQRVFSLGFCVALFAMVHVKVCCGQIASFGSCEEKNVTVKSDFDITRYLGQWFEQKRYFVEFERGLMCGAVEYSALPDGIDVKSYGFTTTSHAIQKTLWKVTMPNADEPAKLFSVQSPRNPRVPGVLWIVDTDYETYSITYSCQNTGSFRLESAWLLSRRPGPFSNGTMAHIDGILRKNDIEQEAFLHVDQSDCPWDLLFVPSCTSDCAHPSRIRF